MRDACFLEPLKVYPRFFEHLDRIIHDVLLPEVELEVELPGGHPARQVAIDVCDCEADLDEAGVLDIVPDVLVL